MFKFQLIDVADPYERFIWLPFCPPIGAVVEIGLERYEIDEIGLTAYPSRPSKEVAREPLAGVLNCSVADPIPWESPEDLAA
jgi:hypothetical protein